MFKDTVPVSGRRRVLNFPVSIERQIGHATFNQMSRQYADKHLLVSHDDRQSHRVRRVLGALLLAVPELVGPRTGWQFIVVQSPEINAFALPGGRVIVNTGLLDFAQTDDELAVVLSHEIAHVVARHGAEKMTGIAVGRLLRFLVGGFVNSDKMWTAFFSLTSELPQSRQLEAEADQIGLFIAAKAGVCPDWAPVFWHKIMAATDGAKQTPKWLSTHPPSATRATDLAHLAPQVMPLFLDQRKKLTWWEAYFTTSFTSCDSCPKTQTAK
jgi:metalloendopeptidase OMA1, mitochondrial